MSGKSTRKGKVYEREVARMLRAAWPVADVRRTSQADRAGNSDVIATGHPVLEGLWLELNDARRPDPLAKLRQAERDVRANQERGGGHRMPVVIWHRIHERSHQVTTRLWVLDALRDARGWSLPLLGSAVITLDLQEFIEIVDCAAAAGAAAP